MQRLDKVLIILSAVILLSIATVGATSAVKPHQNTVEPPVTVQSLDADKIFDLVNQERINAGLKPLIRDDRLNQSSQIKADDMVANKYRTHENPATGKNITWSNPIFNQICRKSSENLSWGYGSENQAVAGWMGSKSHHDAILDSQYTSAGLAVNGDVVVEHFCSNK